MKEDNISQLGDYGAPFCEQEYTYGSCYISLFKFKSFDQFNTPQTASNFRHLLSCGIGAMSLAFQCVSSIAAWQRPRATRPENYSAHTIYLTEKSICAVSGFLEKHKLINKFIFRRVLKLLYTSGLRVQTNAILDDAIIKQTILYST